MNDEYDLDILAQQSDMVIILMSVQKSIYSVVRFKWKVMKNFYLFAIRDIYLIHVFSSSSSWGGSLPAPKTRSRIMNDPGE